MPFHAILSQQMLLWVVLLGLLLTIALAALLDTDPVWRLRLRVARLPRLASYPRLRALLLGVARREMPSVLLPVEPRLGALAQSATPATPPVVPVQHTFTVAPAATIPDLLKALTTYEYTPKPGPYTISPLAFTPFVPPPGPPPPPDPPADLPGWLTSALPLAMRPMTLTCPLCMLEAERTRRGDRDLDEVWVDGEPFPCPAHLQAHVDEWGLTLREVHWALPEVRVLPAALREPAQLS